MTEVRHLTSKAERVFLISSESGNESHPDKACDKVSDLVLGARPTSDPKCRAACEICVKHNKVMVAGKTYCTVSIVNKTVVDDHMMD